MDPVDLEFEIPAAPEAVFDHFTEIDLLTRWWPSSGETDPREGGAYRLYWDAPDVTLRGRYVEVDRPSRLRFTWSWDHDDDDSVVTLDLMSIGPITSLRIRQTAASDEERRGYIDGWTYFVGRLRDELTS